MTVSALCRSCALCCEGALFRYALLAEGEALRLEQLGVPTTARRDGSKALRLGCSAVRERACGIYPSRPRACEAFFCQLAFRVRDGLTGFDEAAKVVAEARQLLADVAAGLPPPADGEPPSVLERAYQHGLRDGPAPLRRAERFLQEHFL